MGPYEVVYADPPWRYQFAKGYGREVERHYPTMESAEIQALPVPVAKSAALYLWTTAPQLAEGLKVVEAWGFEYKTCAVWDKATMGLGNWFRIRHELLLVGSRGGFSPPPVEVREESIYTQRRGEHSEKPDWYRRYIEQAHPEARRIEVFAREACPGWDAWGNEVGAIRAGEREGYRIPDPRPRRTGGDVDLLSSLGIPTES